MADRIRVSQGWSRNRRSISAVTTLRKDFHCTDEELAALREPRDDIVGEREVEADDYALEHGAFRTYRRTLKVKQAESGGWDVEQTTRYTLAIPVFGWLFRLPTRRALHNRKDRFSYWWAPPDRLDAHAATILGLLCGVQIVDGYLGTVLTQTLTFATTEFGRGNTAQGVVFGVVRIAIVIALGALALADKRGRRPLLIGSGIAGCAMTFVGGLSPNIWFLGGTQLVARGFSTALGILIIVVATEEMPARSRAWAASVLALSAGLGAGMAVWILPVADTSIRGWRAIYLVAALGIAVMVWAGKRLPETRRFAEGLKHPPALSLDDRKRRKNRLLLLAVSAYLTAMFFIPASSFQNDFLRDERGFDATTIALFTFVTSTPIGIGVLIGGYLAESRGRRRVGALGLSIGTVCTAWAFFLSGTGLWLVTLAGSVLGAIAIPALAVYGPELFGTHDRARANGILVTGGVMGSATGLLVAGLLSDRWGNVGSPLALLAAGPMIVVTLILTIYPETAGKELEELNPEDA